MIKSPCAHGVDILAGEGERPYRFAYFFTLFQWYANPSHKLRKQEISKSLYFFIRHSIGHQVSIQLLNLLIHPFSIFPRLALVWAWQKYLHTEIGNCHKSALPSPTPPVSCKTFSSTLLIKYLKCFPLGQVQRFSILHLLPPRSILPEVIIHRSAARMPLLSF